MLANASFSLRRRVGVFFCVAFLSFAAGRAASADLLDDHAALTDQWGEALVDSYRAAPDPAAWAATAEATRNFAARLTSPEARGLLLADLAAPHDAVAAARQIGQWQGRLQHAVALEMIALQQAGRIDEAREWRVLIALPRTADGVEGALILQRLAAQQKAQEAGVSQLLARECLTWQTTRVREKLDGLGRLLASGNGAASAALVAGRVGEIEALATFPPRLRLLVPGAAAVPAAVDLGADFYASIDGTALAAAGEQRFDRWREGVEAALPDLLRPEDVARRERLTLKLLHLVPAEYQQAGVRENGEMNVPLEYRHAQSFTVQAEQIIDELTPNWRRNKADAVRTSLPAVQEGLAALEKTLAAKAPLAKVKAQTAAVTGLLEGAFGLTLRRTGPKESVIDETVVDVKAALGASLAAAQNGKWADAESYRLDAYTGFDLELEKRVLPRDPDLGLRGERSFLDGEPGAPGVKAVLDARSSGPALAAAYDRANRALEECASMLKVNISPATVTFTTITIFAREGLEAVVVLAALLAGLRGVENQPTRRRIVGGAWLALAVTGLTFWLSKSLIQSLSRWGEKLEAVISILAVIILLMVTNWVFHKFYWVGWNAKIRGLSKAAQGGRHSAWGESMALIGVGFLTIYREGFETTLFLQSLILEGGLKPVLVGIGLGSLLVAVMGGLIFLVGVKLPYRKLLVYTGVLVVGVLATFLGSSVRLFQTVGWLPIHPIEGLHFPAWVGLWFGLYPSWEGILVPMLGLGYVAGAWLWVKWQSSRKAPAEAPPARHPAPRIEREPAESVA